MADNMKIFTALFIMLMLFTTTSVGAVPNRAGEVVDRGFLGSSSRGDLENLRESCISECRCSELTAWLKFVCISTCALSCEEACQTSEYLCAKKYRDLAVLHENPVGLSSLS